VAYAPNITLTGNFILDRSDCGYRLNFLVENQVIVELKSVDEIHPIFLAQVLTYLRLLDKQVGLLINFNVPVLRDGIKRIVNNYKPE
jgi:GxxExxY protein